MLHFLSHPKGTPAPQPRSTPAAPKPNPEAAATTFVEDDAVRGLCDLYSPEPVSRAHVRDTADVLQELGKVTDEQMGRLRRELLSRPGMDAATWLLKEGIIDPNDVLMAKARLSGMEFRTLKPEDVDKQAFAKLDLDFIQRSSIVPVQIENGVLLVATSEPANVFAVEEVKRQTQMDVNVVVCSPGDIQAVCTAFSPEPEETNLDDIMNDMTQVEVVQDQQKDESDDLEQMAGQSPVIKFVNYLISNALHEGASDIHIEPKEKYTKIRYRIDGVLFDAMQAPVKMHPAIVSRIKIMANLDISERRIPQDGKIAVIMGGRAIDLRISILPTSHGEEVVIRLLDSKQYYAVWTTSAWNPPLISLISEQIDMPHGILLVTGPTGSGKSTTLYFGLAQMDGAKLNISTVEDPVEYSLEFCNQVQVNEKIGMTFSAALRSLLRQDPDIIMIGEIRDTETARIAVQAALTGHLVLSTLHTNDAPSSVSRLVNIGIEPYLIAASLNGILAQRLVRRICSNCKEPYEVPDNMQKYLERAKIDPATLMHGEGLRPLPQQRLCRPRRHLRTADRR